MRLDPVWEAYREKAWTVAARQIPFGVGIFFALLLTGTALDLVHSGERWPILIALNLACAGIAALVLGLVGRGPRWAFSATTAATVAAGLLLSGYGAWVGGSAEMCVVSLTILLAGVALLCPWGARGQAIASLGAVLGYPAALFAGLDAALDPLYGIGGLAATAAFTIHAAGLMDRYRLRDFRAVAELESREGRLQSYFDLAQVGMATLSPRRAWIEANDVVCRMLGYRQAELLRRTWDEVVRPEDLASQREWFGRAERGSDEDLKTETHLVCKDGEVVPAMLALRCLRRSDGDLQSFVAIIRDLTEPRRAQEELRAAKEQAEAANRTKSNFLATMSHEIRTPMNLIFGMTEMALDADPNPQQREYLKKTRAAAGTLQVLLSDVLDFSKIEAGKLGLRPRDFDIRVWLEESLGPLVWLANEKGLRVTCAVSPDVPERILGDPDRLGQVIVNLVTNAIKFTDRGTVTIAVEPAFEGGPGGAPLHFAVCDSGIGIPAADRHRIFDAFAQAPSADAPEREGAGLGLAICARLVELMGGRIWVESEVGTGSEFHFTAQLAVPGAATWAAPSGEAPTSPKASAPPEPHATPRPPGSRDPSEPDREG